MPENPRERALAPAAGQRSHLLLVLSNAEPGKEARFRAWLANEYRSRVAALDGVLRFDLRESHDVDITLGRFPSLGFQFLALVDLVVDGAADAEPIVTAIQNLHQAEPSAGACATWLYYPACEKIGEVSNHNPNFVAIAFANAIPGMEQEFREWYSTRHLRHALLIPALTGGQCFERTIHQVDGAEPAAFQTIAIYEHAEPPEAILESYPTIPWERLAFPALDPTRFSEWVFQRLRSGVSKD